MAAAAHFGRERDVPSLTLVFQLISSLLAMMPAVTVVPLLPPQPTSMTPSLGTLVLVLNSYVCFSGATSSSPSGPSRTAVVLYSYVASIASAA